MGHRIWRAQEYSHQRLCADSVSRPAGERPNRDLVFAVTEWLNIALLLLWGHEEFRMEWTTPDFVEIELNCEINSYANAEL